MTMLFTILNERKNLELPKSLNISNSNESEAEIQIFRIKLING